MKAKRRSIGHVKNPSRLLALLFVGLFFLLVVPIANISANPGDTVDVEANFHLYGEMYRFSGLGWGSLELEFGVNSETLATGSIDFPLSEEPTSSGVLESVSVSGAGWNIIDTSFTVPFQLREGENASLYLKLDAGAIRTVIDFSDDIRFKGSVLPEGKEGLTLTSITVPDGYQFRFIDENTIFEAFGTDGADQRTVTSTAPDPAILSFNLVRSSVLMDPVSRLSISPDPNPLVYDFAYAQISGTENIVVMPVSVPYVVSSDDTGTEQNRFELTDDVYCYAGNLPISTDVDIYVVANKDVWNDGDGLTDVSGGYETKTTESDGSIAATKIWSATLIEGEYDIVVDTNRNGEWNTGEPIDSEVDVGFTAVPEFTTIAIPVAAVLGLVFLFSRRSRHSRKRNN